MINRGLGARIPVCQYLYLPFNNDLICHLSVFFALLDFAAGLLVTEQPECLRALQLNLKLLPHRTQHTLNTGSQSRWAADPVPPPDLGSHLVPVWLRGVPVHASFGFIDKVAKGVHLQRAVEI